MLPFKSVLKAVVCSAEDISLTLWLVFGNVAAAATLSFRGCSFYFTETFQWDEKRIKNKEASSLKSHRDAFQHLTVTSCRLSKLKPVSLQSSDPLHHIFSSVCAPAPKSQQVGLLVYPGAWYSTSTACTSEREVGV